ncbi:hypothetical protein POM88_044735 [Heracleum sosnowskyi]|uniref:Splicing factor cactin central domain-containing protein n=2 Tax=Heracleum sosnowskyi TaxID=360622 RepID=A0AAD8H4M6_9APIA|nr:hypothetical protein POM88_044728 [Heracleum sosnowskyi]KAK1360261.1 hypothetical protein POM88_044735 [Heracleum sosnowskyi]
MSSECSVMGTKRTHWSAESSYEKQITWKVAKKIKSSHLPLKIMCSVKEESKNQRERTEEFESNQVDGSNICENFVRGKKIERDVIGARIANTKNSHLPLKVMCSVIQDKIKEIESIGEIECNPIDGTNIGDKFVWKKKIEGDVIGTRSMDIMCSVIEEKRREIQRIREIEKVKKSWEEKMIKKAEEIIDFSGRVRGQQPPADDPRGLHSSTVADVKNLLQGKSHSELEVLQSDIMLQMCSGSVNDAEYWETVLKLIYEYKVKACLKDVHAKVFWKNLQKDLRSLSYAGKNDQRKTDEAEGSGSPEIFHGEEIGDNFTMKTMGAVMEDGDALSSNNDEVILQSQVYCCHNRCRPRKSKYLNRVLAEYGWNNYNPTH